jgi:hypothetical protein
VKFKLKLGVATVAVALVSVVALTPPALAYWVSGYTFMDGGTQLLPYTHITITNNTTGAKGSTNSNSSGAYSFTGMVAGNRYSMWGCWNHNTQNAIATQFTQPAQDYVKHIFYIDQYGVCNT